MDRGGGGGKMEGFGEDEASTNQSNNCVNGCLHKKRKSQYELDDPRLSSLKYKFRDRLTWQNEGSGRTESLECDGIFIHKNCDVDMVNRVEDLESDENTQSLLAGCIEVDSINGVENQPVRKMFWDQASTSSSSSNNISYDACSSFHSSGAKETNSWVMYDPEHDHPVQMLETCGDDMGRLYEVLEQYDGLMTQELASNGVDGSNTHLRDQMLYSNGLEDFLILPKGRNGCDGEKKLTVDQEFEQYFSTLML